jgi:methionine-rich copper-binding protein CopC
MVNSSVAASPKTVDLEFNEDVQITALKLQAGDARDTDIGPLPKAPARRISVPLPTLTAGSYTLIWRALGDDNHVVTGKIPFKVGPDAHGGKAQ